MDNKVKQAIDFAKQNPDSQYATELRRRIESGALDNELHSAGLSQYAKAPKQDGVLKSIAKDVAGTLVVKPVARATEAVTRTVFPESTASKGYEAMVDEGGQEIAGIDVSQKAFGEGGGRQIIGETLKIGSFLFPYGKVAGALGGKIAGNIASGATGGYLADVGVNLSDTEKSVSESFKPGLGTTLGAVIPTTGAVVKGARNLKAKVSPVKSTEETIGKIIQGETSDIPMAIDALNAIDTSKIKTRPELSKTLQTAKEELMNVVDTELAKDSRVLPLDNYVIRVKNEAGQEVKTDVIRNAFTDLKELFASTADDLSLSNLELLEQKALNEGLTHQEVNNLARLYSQEFGAKAFNKLGDPLTSVNAQRFQNTRSGLKQAARGGLGFGEEAAQADRLYSAMENTQRLIDKGVEGVNKLQQRVQERGILEKLSRNVVNTLNTLSGGTLKGAASAVFPSNVGLKTLNWLDLEKQLGKDLEFINKANTIKEDGALIKFINENVKKLQFPGDKAVDEISATLKNASKIPNKQGGFVSVPLKGKGTISENTLISEAKKYKSAEEFVKAQGDKPDLFSEYTPFKAGSEYANFYSELKKKYGDYALINLTDAENAKLVKLSKNNIPSKGTPAPKPVEQFRGTKDDVITGDELFHATTPDRIDKIATEGLKINTGGREAMSTRGEINPLFFSDSPNHALGFIQDLKNEMLIPENTKGVLLRVRGLPKENLVWDSLGKNNSAMSGGSWSFDKNIPAKYIEIKENGVWKPLLDKTKSQLTDIWKKANQQKPSK